VILTREELANEKAHGGEGGCYSKDRRGEIYTEDDNSQSETDQVTTAAGYSGPCRTGLDCARIALDHLAGAIVRKVLDGKKKGLGWGTQ
jgi:hypothetical protein